MLSAIKNIATLPVRKILYCTSPYYKTLRSRPKANRAIAHLSRMVETNTEGSILCEAFWDNPHHWIRVAMLRCALAEEYGAGLIGVHEETTKKEWLKSLQALPLTAEEYISHALKEEYLENADKMLSQVTDPRELCAMKFPGDYPACYFYDGVLKKDRVGQVDIHSPRLKNYLALTLKYLDDFQSLVDRHDIRAAIVSHPTHFRFSTLVWVLIYNNIPVFLTNYLNGHITIRKITKSEHMIEPYDDVPTIEEIRSLSKERRKTLIETGDRYLNKVCVGKESQVSMVGVYGSGQLKYTTREKFCERLGADPDKPLVVIMANCWPDFPNGYGPTYFTDYVDWFLLTFSAIQKIEGCNWVLKPHPAEHQYGEATTLKKLVGDDLPEGIFYWPEGATGVEVGAYAHCIVTAMGTSAIEYAAKGMRTIVATTSPYTDFGFTNYARTEDEYIDLLKNVADLSVPTRKQQEDAMIYAATVLADHDGNSTLRFPYGALSYRLYPSLPGFIKENLDGIKKETDLMKKWAKSGHGRYNTYKVLYNDN